MERLQSLLDAAPDAMLAVDADGIIVAFNDQAERVFGYAAEDIVGHPVELLIPEGARPGHPEHRRRYMHRPSTRPMGAGLHLAARHRDGSTFPSEISLSPLESETGPLVIAAVRDVTVHRQAEQTFRGLLEAAPDAMVVVDGGGVITMVNGQAEVLFDWPRDELLGQAVEVLVPEWARPSHPAQRQRYMRHPITRPMGEGRELEGRRRDGSTFPSEISLSSFDTPEGPLVSAAIRDVTARKAVEHEIRAARQEAERANRAKSEFLSRMSHELRTPLNAILGFAQLLEYNDPRHDQAEHVDYILKGGKHLLALIDEVLDISRIEAGHIALELEPVSVADAVGAAIDLVRPLAREQSILIRIDADSSRRTAVLADPQRLKQVILNVLANGIKYNHEGGEIRIRWHAAASGRVTIDISDTGVGIREEMMDRLFLPFERLDQGSSSVAGTGLGLALSRGLVESMGGSMGAESVYGQGSRFWIELEGVLAADEGRAAAPPPAMRPSPPAPEVTRRVLYVEDNLSNLRLVESILKRRPDVELIPTLQGAMALELAVRHQPDLVLLDLDLPDLAGGEVLALLQGNAATASIPVVVVSADAVPARTEALLEQGAVAYITKPIDVGRFLAVIEKHLPLPDVDVRSTMTASPEPAESER